MDSTEEAGASAAGPPRDEAPGLRATLRNADFLRAWVAGTCAGTMRWLEILAVAVYTLQETGSAFLVAVMYFARTGPTLLCGPLAGILAERVARRPLLAGGLAVMTVLAGTLAGLALSGGLALWHVACGAVVSGVIWSLEHTVRRTIVRDVVAPDAVGNAISLDTGTQNATRMVGPLAGGALMAAVGLQGAFALGVVFYASALILVLSIRAGLPGAGGRNVSVLGSVAAALRYAGSNPLVAGVLAVTVVMNLLGFPYLSMVPVIGRDTLGLDAAEVGALMSAEGGGAVLGALVLAVSVQRRHYTRLFTGGCTVFALAILVFSRQTGYVAAAGCLFVAGLGLGAFAAMQSTILLTATEAAMRTRVMGLLVVAIGSGPLGVLLLGGLSEWLGASTALTSTASACVVLLALTVARWSDLAKPVA